MPDHISTSKGVKLLQSNTREPLKSSEQGRAAARIRLWDLGWSEESGHLEGLQSYESLEFSSLGQILR